MERKKVGNRIRELREMHNYTREGMAEMVEISPKFLYEIESGKKGFSSDVLCKIARTLTVSCDYIMYGEEHSLRNGEKIYYILNQLETEQAIKIQFILKILIEICDAMKYKGKSVEMLCEGLRREKT